MQHTVITSIKAFIFLGLFISCHLNWQRADLPELELLSTHKLDVPEPSGLFMHPHTGHLWTVSDNNGDLYEILPEGQKVLRLKTGVGDAEGVCFNPDNGGFIIADEASNEIVYYSIEADKEKSISLGEIAGLSPKHGLEGLCYVSSTKSYAALAEKFPGMLIEFSAQAQEIKTSYLDFAADYSGITYDARHQAYWILSDESAILSLYHPKQGTLAQYKIPAQKAEGIALSIEKMRIYLVYDDTNTMQVFTLPQMKNELKRQRK